jgi:hypothetical protein
MKRCFWRIALACLAVALNWSASPAIYQIAPNGLPMRWNFSFYDSALFPDQNPTTLAIRYHLSAQGWSAGNRVAELDAIRAAFGQWQAVAGTRIKFEEGALVNGATDVNALDGQNMVVWLPDNRFINGGVTFFPTGLAGITVLSGSDTDETIAEADIVLNANKTWFTKFDPTETDGLFVEEVALHEIGHFLGLNHSPLGGATMFWFSPQGVGPQAGLSPDEIAAARTLYGLPATLGALGKVTGTVSLGGASVLGANLTIEDTNGIVISATVTDAGGRYLLSALAPGNYTLRITALDPGSNDADAYLVRGLELDPYVGAYNNAAAAFLPLTNQAVTVTAGGTLTKNFTLNAGNPPFRITGTRQFLTPDGRQNGDICVQLRPGQSNAWVGVYVPTLNSANATLRLTGGGITYGDTVVVSNALRGMYLVQVPVSVASNAISGLRSLSVTANGSTAWANGFFEVLPAVYDFNFDGLDDVFQRRYWSPFTRTEAAPEADPDGDGFVNRREATMGSDPTTALSVNYRITKVKLAVNGTTVTWESAPGRRYQVYSRDNLQGAAWQAVGGPVTAAAGPAGETAQFLDVRPTDALRFYQVRDAP